MVQRRSDERNTEVEATPRQGAVASARAVVQAHRPVRCQVWGVLNVTPDSFSDGGMFFEWGSTQSQLERLVSERADVIDIGGQSTRPRGGTYGDGAVEVSTEEELRRVVPAVEHAVNVLQTRVSVDTTNAEVARRAIDAGAHIINDVSCGRSPELIRIVANSSAELVLMHSRGLGETEGDNVRYDDVVREVCDELHAAVRRAREADIPDERIWVDPGFGFAKTWKQSAACFEVIRVLAASGYRLLAGPSRKAFLAEIVESKGGARLQPQERLAATIAACVLSHLSGASAVRVHDVAAVRQALDIAEYVGLQSSHDATLSDARPTNASPWLSSGRPPC